MVVSGLGSVSCVMHWPERFTKCLQMCMCVCVHVCVAVCVRAYMHACLGE